jgi:hypothetical protein
MDLNTPMPQLITDHSDMPLRDREVLKLAIRSLLMVHCQQHDPGALPRADRLPHMQRRSN